MGIVPSHTIRVAVRRVLRQVAVTDGEVARAEFTVTVEPDATFVAPACGRSGAGFAASHIGIRTSLLAASAVVATPTAAANRGVRALSVKSAQEVSPTG